ncbi:MAG TPA: hypothetical protein VGQ80_07940, partial [Acidimicrobiia bacterium]|nr:hypothetical protein [Acidimicrobiia bacterium]
GGHQHSHHQHSHHQDSHHHEPSVADELDEVKHRLADLSAAVDALLARQLAEAPPAESTGPDEGTVA